MMRFCCTRNASYVGSSLAFILPAMQCPNCNTAILNGDRFCEECGTPVFVPDKNQCPKCAAGMIDREGFCQSCGFRAGEKKDARIVLTQNASLACASDPGLKHFPNEDGAAIATANHKQYLVVCDGVSSSDRPERASSLAATTACQALSEGKSMLEAIALATEAVQRIPTSNDRDPASTTLVSALVEGQNATIAWIGDSRAYWVANNLSQCLTQDHSWANDMVTSGKMTHSAALRSSNAHAITRWIGADNLEDTEPSMISFAMPSAGHLILCSDGLWNYLTNDSELPKLIRAAPQGDAEGIANHLVDFARSRGGHDNITVAVYVNPSN
jgi:PPM family protein phosphatase